MRHHCSMRTRDTLEYSLIINGRRRQSQFVMKLRLRLLLMQIMMTMMTMYMMRMTSTRASILLKLNLLGMHLFR